MPELFWDRRHQDCSCRQLEFQKPKSYEVVLVLMFAVEGLVYLVVKVNVLLL